MSTVDSKNPFCLEPIRLPAQFFGRAKETRRVLRSLHLGQSVSIYGPARIGKTSLLLHIIQPYVREEQGLAKEWVFAYLDCYSLDGLGPGECYLRIREEVIHQVKNTKSVDKAVGIQLEKAVREAITSGGTEYFGLNTLFRGAQDNGLKLAIVLDHFELLARNHRLDSDFFSSLRSFAMSYETTYLVASRSRLYSLEQIRPEVSSPFFNFFHSVHLGKFAPEESRELVTELLKHVNVKFPECATNCILELGNNEPGRLQRAGYIAFQAWQENRGNLRAEHCEKISLRFEKVI
jgi:hypothetical protein